jgi:hypothetical protein
LLLKNLVAAAAEAVLHLVVVAVLHLVVHPMAGVHFDPKDEQLAFIKKFSSQLSLLRQS